MLLKTDIEKVRKAALILLYTSIEETSFPFVASHPFTNSWIVSSPANGDLRVLDLHKIGDCAEWRTHIKHLIQISDLSMILLLLQKPYILLFLRMVEPYLTNIDLGVALSSNWTRVETISLNRAVEGKTILSWFKRADKESLMSEEERAALNDLPNTVTVYRGVTSFNRKRKKALSWTTDRSVAEWFANRFDTGTGEIWRIEIPKERILCYFSGRNESEVIVNLYGLKEKATVERI